VDGKGGREEERKCGWLEEPRVKGEDEGGGMGGEVTWRGRGG